MLEILNPPSAAPEPLPVSRIESRRRGQLGGFMALFSLAAMGVFWLLDAHYAWWHWALLAGLIVSGALGTG